jgi:hypothetical protein
MFSCFKKGCRRMACFTGFLLLLLVLLGAYFTYVGFPAPFTERVKVEVSKRGLLLDFDRLRLNVSRGVVAQEVRILDKVGRGQILTCNEVHLDLDWVSGIKDGDWLERLGIREGTLYPGALSILPKNLNRPWLAMSNLSTFITIETNAFRMEPFHAELRGLPIKGKGLLMRTSAQEQISPALSVGGDKRGEREAVQSVVDRIWPVLEGLQWSQDSAMSFDFLIDPGNHSADRVTVEAGGNGARVRGQWFDNWRASLALNGEKLTIEEISAGHSKKRAHVNGAFDLEKKLIELHAYSGLEPACVLALLPWKWAEAVQGKMEIREGGLETECWVGPVPFHQAASAITGWTKIRQATFSGVWIEEGFASWKSEGSDVILERLKLICGTGRAQGEIDGDFRIDTATKEWDCSLTTTLDPHVLIPITPTNLVKLTRRFEFSGKNPKIDLSLKSRGQPKPQLEFKGTFEGEDFSYQSVPGLRTDSGIQYSDKILRLDPFYTERDEGDIYGWLEVDLRQKVSTFDLKSSVHPQALGQIVSTNIGRLVRYLGVEGAGQWAARGRADYGAKTNSNFEVQTRMRDASLWKFNSRDLDLSFSSITTNLQFLIRNSEFYGGSLTGRLDIAQTQLNRDYQAQFYIADVDFDPLLSIPHKREGSPMEGKVNGYARFNGTLQPFQLPGTEGRAKIRISEASLFRLPILGGLSKLLSKIFPGRGFTARQDLTATITLRDEKFYSKNIQISGPTSSIQMDGRYHFGHDLDFDVKGQPLGRGLVADVVQLITLPISKLLEFQLKGTLDQPVWKAKHWPKELSSSQSKEGGASE